MQSRLPLLITQVRSALQLNQGQLAERIGSSKRTVQRWEAERAAPVSSEIQRMADEVRPHDQALAAQLDALAPRPVPSAPELAPAPVAIEPPPVPAAPIPAPVLVDSVVCAAAEAMSVTPQTIRPAVLAAFARACEARLLAQDVVAVLAPPPPLAPAPEALVVKAKGGKRA